MPVIPALGKLRQKDFKFNTSLGNIERACLKSPSPPKMKVAWHREEHGL
jgi:hypothetical protein